MDTPAPHDDDLDDGWEPVTLVWLCRTCSQPLEPGTSRVRVTCRDEAALKIAAVHEGCAIPEGWTRDT